MRKLDTADNDIHTLGHLARQLIRSGCGCLMRTHCRELLCDQRRGIHVDRPQHLLKQLVPKRILSDGFFQFFLMFPCELTGTHQLVKDVSTKRIRRFLPQQVFFGTITTTTHPVTQYLLFNKAMCV